MPTWKTLKTYVRNPSRIPERWIEKRMNARACRYYASQTTEMVDQERETVLGQHARTLAAEARSTDVFRQLVIDRQDSVLASQSSSLEDCVTMYVLIRLYQPQIMVETGVFYGAMSAMILEAMAVNGGGKLYSIDLPFPDDGVSIERRGGLVPVERRANWELILGGSREKLPSLLNRLGTIDAFNHDSLHSTQHMRWEFNLAWSYIKAGGFLSSHDVLTTPAWLGFCRQQQGSIQKLGRVFGLGFVAKRS